MNSPSRITGQDGHVLVAAVVMLFVISVFGFSFLKMASYSGIETQIDARDKQVFWIAEEGLSKAVSLMGSVTNPNGLTGQTLPFNHQGNILFAEFRVVEDTTAKNLSYWVTSRVYSQKNPGSALFKITARYGILSGASFIFIEGTPGEAYYHDGDTIRGSVHTNTRLKITGKPVFISQILESGHDEEIDGFICRPFSLCEPNIVGPKPIWGAPTYRFDDLSRQIRRAPNVINVATGKQAKIVLQGDSYTLWTRDMENDNMLINPVKMSVPQGDGIWVNGNVEVEGVLDGRLTIGASGNIIITDHIRYIDSDSLTGKPAPGSGSILGLIAEKNVEVRQAQNDFTRSKGIVINAAIIAMDKSFHVDDPYDQSRANKNKTHGVMRLWGNIVQAERGVVGSYRIRDNLTRGFTKNWNYDSRFSRLNIPYYPPLKDERGTMRFLREHWESAYVERG